MAKQPRSQDISGKRIAISIAIVAAFGVSSFFLLVCRSDFEGGASVSLFTLGLVCSGLFLIYPKVSSIVVAGHEIKLHRLTVEAEEEIARLKENRLNLYRVALALVMKHSGGFGSGWESDGRVPEILELLGYIDKEWALPQLCSEVRGKFHPIVEKQVRFIREKASSYIDQSLPENKHEIIESVKVWLSKVDREKHEAHVIEMFEREARWLEAMLSYYERADAEYRLQHMRAATA